MSPHNAAHESNTAIMPPTPMRVWPCFLITMNGASR